MPSDSQLRLLLRHRVELEVNDDPALTRFNFHAPDGPVRVRADEAVGPLSQGIRAMNADTTVRAWATPAIVALRLMAGGRLMEPTAGDQQQLQSASRAIDPDPHRAQFLVHGFLAALASTAPDVAVTTQRYRAPTTTARTPRRTATYSYVMHVVFDEAPADGYIATVRLHIRNNDRGWAPVDIRELWAHPDHFLGNQARDAATAMLDRMRNVWEPAERFLGSIETGEVRVTADELAALGRGQTVTHLLAQRVEVQWPAELTQHVSARAVVRESDQLPAAESDSVSGGFFDRDRLFNFDWRIAVGDKTLTEVEAEELATAHHGLVKLRDQWMFVEPDRLQQVLNRPGGTLTAADALRATVTGTVEISGRDTPVDTAGFLDDVRRRLEQRPAAEHCPQPHALAGTLRDYQLDGVHWLSQLTDLGLGGCLADDMGLGKTIMVIALHLQLGQECDRPTLVVCPASVIGNWEREITNFAPSVPVYRHHGPERRLDDVKEGFVLTTYATMRKDADALAGLDPSWGLVIADEAQQVKNPRSAAALALRTIPSQNRFALTGTPVENALSELWAILDWATPGLLGSRTQFRQRYISPIERHHDPDRAAELSKLIRPFVLRRRKGDPEIAPELPPKTITDHAVSLSREQVGLYRATVRDTMAKIEGSDGLQRRGLVLKLLTALKQICNHPAHFLRQHDEKLAGRSGKLDSFDELLDQIIAEDASALVFTQYAQMGKLLERHLTERSISSMFLSGQTSVSHREDMVQRFQRGDVPVFVLSLRAAGVGLNLTAADHVIHYDRWWNPAVEDQATDRAHRIGQDKPVQVHRFSTEGTVEESIADLISAKRSLADSIINNAEDAITELSDADLAQLVQYRG